MPDESVVPRFHVEREWCPDARRMPNRYARTGARCTVVRGPARAVSRIRLPTQAQCTLRNYLLSPNGTYRRGFRPKSPSGSLQDRETLQVDRIAHREATRRTLRQRRPCAGRQQRSCRRAGTYHAARELSACVAHVVRRQHARAEYMSGLRRDESRPIALGGHHWSATECLPRTRTAGMSTKKRMAAS